MRRGDVVTVALSGEYGKPRPAVIVQSDFFALHPSVTVLPITSELRNTPLFRVAIQPDADNGLRQPSQAMIDKIVTIGRGKIGARVGSLEPGAMLEISRRLAIFLGIAR